MTMALVSDYYLGSSAEDIAGGDLDREYYTNAMELSMRDLAALADGFSTVTIGSRERGGRMYIGDVYAAQTVKFTQESRGDSAPFRDHTCCWRIIW